MKFSFKNLLKLIFRIEKTNTTAGFMPTIYDNHPDGMKLVDSFIEKMFYKQMYFYINKLKIDKNIIKQTNVFYNSNYVSFLLYLSRSFDDNSADYDINIKTAINIKTKFYKDVCESIITQISPMLKTLFYRNFNYLSVPKINAKQIKRKRNIFIQIKEALKNQSENIDSIKQYTESFILDLYVDQDEIFIDYILDWIKMKLDMLSAELTVWRKYIVNNNEIFRPIKELNIIHWHKQDVLEGGSYAEDSISQLFETLVSLAEYDLFVKKLNKMMNLDNYSE